MNQLDLGDMEPPESQPVGDHRKMDNQLIEILQGANVAMRLVSARLVTILALLMTFVIFCWAMYLQTVISVCIAAIFLVLFLCVLWAGRRGSD